MKTPDITEPPPGRRSDSSQAKRNWPTRIAWFIGLWLAGVATVAAISYGIRLWIM